MMPLAEMMPREEGDRAPRGRLQTPGRPHRRRGTDGGRAELAGYVMRHGERVLDAMRSRLPDHLRRAVRHIRDKDMQSFIANDLRAALRSTAADTDAMLEGLADLGYVRTTGETRGAKKAPVWEANPNLWEADQ